ncbi:hypothetical protein ACOMHN_001143 [Nucella lapillus]
MADNVQQPEEALRQLGEMLGTIGDNFENAIKVLDEDKKQILEKSEAVQRDVGATYDCLLTAAEESRVRVRNRVVEKASWAVSEKSGHQLYLARRLEAVRSSLLPVIQTMESSSPGPAAPKDDTIRELRQQCQSLMADMAAIGPLSEETLHDSVV